MGQKSLLIDIRKTGIHVSFVGLPAVLPGYIEPTSSQ
jgi:hypothetical protein